MDINTKGVTTIPYFTMKSSLDIGNSERKIAELPWPYYDSMGLKFPTAGGPFLRYFGNKYIQKGLDQSLIRGDTLFYFHPLDIGRDKYPIGNFRNRPFYWYGQGKKTEKSIVRILNNLSNKGRFCTCSQIADGILN